MAATNLYPSPKPSKPTQASREGVMRKQYWQIALPAVLEGLLIVLLSSVDLMMISSLGTEAVAAVSIFSQPKMVILCFSRSLAVAVTALIALKVGQGEKRLSSIMRPSISVAGIGAGILLCLSIFYIKPILKLAGAEDSYLEMAISYGQLVAWSLFFNGMSLVINGGLTGLGKTMPMLLANVVGNIVNVLLNALFIYHYKWGVVGAGVATVIGSIIALGITLVFAQREMQLVSLKRYAEWLPHKAYLKEIGAIAGGVFAEQGFERIGMFLYSRLVAELGLISFATHNICMTLCDIYYNVGQGMSKASLTLAGQYRGKADYKGLRHLTQFAQKSGMALAIMAAAIYLVFRMPLISLYSEVPEVVQLGGHILIIVGICCIPQTQSLIASGILRGLGQTAYVAKYSLWSIAIIRPIVTWLLCFGCGLGLYGAWGALLLDQTTRMACAVYKVRRLQEEGDFAK